MRELKPKIHLGLYFSTEITGSHYYKAVIAGLITFGIRVFSYFEAGMFYGASAAISLFGLYFLLFFLKRIENGKAVVYYRRDYSQIRKMFAICFNTFLMSLGVFGGNTIYYLSRYRVWNDPSQIGRMIVEIANPAGIAVGVGISFLIYSYLFLQDRYIESKEYARRMYLKMTEEQMNEKEAYKSLILEQDRLHLYGIVPETERHIQATESKKPILKNILSSVKGEDDIYAEARMKRGNKE